MRMRFEPTDGRIPSTRNTTRLSAACDSLLSEFASSGMAQAKVVCEGAGLSQRELYRALWRTACKREFSGKVVVRKVGDRVYLTKK